MIVSRRWMGAVMVALAVALAVGAQQPGRGPAAPRGAKPSDIELVEKLLAARREYQLAMETLRAHYKSVQDSERTHWIEEELIDFHRINKQMYNFDLEMPSVTLKPERNVSEANELYKRAMTFKDKGWGGNSYVDNQRRAELLFLQILTTYPDSDKIDDVAYRLAELYEGKAYQQPKRAAEFYKRCFQWNPKTHFDARLRAARLYDRVLVDRTQAIQMYQEVIDHETEPTWDAEAKKRLQELRGTRQ